MDMQVTMGKLTEAVDSLKTQSAKYGDKLETISKDVHAAKVVVSVVGTLIGAGIALIGWVAKEYLAYLGAQPHKP